MKKYFLGVITGFIVCTMLVSAVAIANSPIKLIVNGNEVKSDVPPQIIDGRTMVPARPLAEALGATVQWDEENCAVVVTGGVQAGAIPTDLEPAGEAANEPINEYNEGDDDMEKPQTGTTSHGVFVPDKHWTGTGFSPMKFKSASHERSSMYFYDVGDDVLVTPTTLLFAFEGEDLAINPSIEEEYTTITSRDGLVDLARIKQYTFRDGIYLFSVNEINRLGIISLRWESESKALYKDEVKQAQEPCQ
jgi:hypothetical protein